MAFIQPLDLYEILVNQLAGSGLIFVILMVFFIATMGAAFKMTGLLIGALTSVFFLMIYSTDLGVGSGATGLFGLIILMFSIFLAKMLHELLAR